MKKIILCLLLMPLFSIAQVSVISETQSILVGRSTFVGKTVIELTYVASKNDTTLTLKYRDYRFEKKTVYESVSFKGGQREINYLFESMYSVFTNKRNRKYSLDISIGNRKAKINRYKSVGFLYSRITFDDGSFIFLNRKAIRHLFSKEKS